MKVRDGFSRVAPIVDNDAKSAFGNSESFRDVTRCHEHAAEQAGVVGRRGDEAGDDSFGHDEDVRGCLGIYVVKSEPLLGFGDDAGGDFPDCDFFKKCHESKSREGELDFGARTGDAGMIAGERDDFITQRFAVPAPCFPSAQHAHATQEAE